MCWGQNPTSTYRALPLLQKRKKREEVCFHLEHSTAWQPQWKECRFRVQQPIGNRHTGSDPGDGCLVTCLHFLVWFVVSSRHRINWHCSIYSMPAYCTLSVQLHFCSYSLPYSLFWLVIAELPLFPASFAVALILWLLPLFISLSMILCSPFPPWQRKLDQSVPNEPLQASKTPTLISLSDSGRGLKEPLVALRRIQ